MLRSRRREVLYLDPEVWLAERTGSHGQVPQAQQYLVTTNYEPVEAVGTFAFAGELVGGGLIRYGQSTFE
jgi:hypothetical protein